MKIFLGWSGEPSGETARVLRQWLDSALPSSAKAFLLSEDQPTGDAWWNGLNAELASADYGILCIAKNNANSLWLQYECGALSVSTKRTAGDRSGDEYGVCPLIVDDSAPEILEAPMRRFQASYSHKESIRRIWRDIVRRLGNSESAAAFDAFERAWPKLDLKLRAVGLREKRPAEVVILWSQALQLGDLKLAELLTSSASTRWVVIKWGSLQGMSDRYRSNRQHASIEMILSEVVTTNAAMVEYDVLYPDGSIQRWTDRLTKEEGIWKVRPEYVHEPETIRKANPSLGWQDRTPYDESTCLNAFKRRGSPLLNAIAASPWNA